MKEAFESKPRVGFEVERIIAVSSDGSYQVQWAPTWVSRHHLYGCEHLIQEFLCRKNETKKSDIHMAFCEENASNNNFRLESQQDILLVPPSEPNELNNSSLSNQPEMLVVSSNDPAESHDGILVVQPHEATESDQLASVPNDTKRRVELPHETERRVELPHETERRVELPHETERRVELPHEPKVLHDNPLFQSGTPSFETNNNVRMCDMDSTQKFLQEKDYETKYTSISMETYQTESQDNSSQNSYQASDEDTKPFLPENTDLPSDVTGVAIKMEDENDGLHQVDKSFSCMTGAESLVPLPSNYPKDITYNISVGHESELTDHHNSVAPYSETYEMKKLFPESTTKKNICTECGKNFPSPSLLRIHFRTHTGEKPYPCPYCEKNFARNDTLKKHVRTHSGEKPYQCPTCGKPFAHKPSLERHYQQCELAVQDYAATMVWGND